MRISILAITVLTLIVSGCTRLGQESIAYDRNEYNSVIDETSSQQLLNNIVKGHFRERPSFFEIQEIDHSKTLGANIQGGSANIGAVLELGSLTSTLTATDQPVLKYVPPSSAAYISQVLQPIPLSSIAYLNNSSTNLLPLLSTSFNDITPKYIDYDYAINTIEALDYFGSINIDPSDGGLVITKRPHGYFTQRAANQSGDNLISCYGRKDGPVNANSVVDELWQKLTTVLHQNSGTKLYLRQSGSKTPPKQEGSAVAVTRSALGALGLAASNHDVFFTSRDEAQKLIAMNEASGCFNRTFYFSGATSEEIARKWAARTALLFLPYTQEAAEQERALGGDRRLIIVQTTADKPDNSYVAINRNRVWYSIDDSDLISKTNFAMLGNIVIIQAVSPPPSTTPTVIPLR